MPDSNINITIGDAAVVEVAKAVQAVCAVIQTVYEKTPEPQLAAQAAIVIEWSKPWLALGKAVNKAFGIE